MADAVGDRRDLDLAQRLHEAGMGGLAVERLEAAGRQGGQERARATIFVIPAKAGIPGARIVASAPGSPPSRGRRSAA